MGILTGVVLFCELKRHENVQHTLLGTMELQTPKYQNTPLGVNCVSFSSYRGVGDKSPCRLSPAALPKSRQGLLSPTLVQDSQPDSDFLYSILQPPSPATFSSQRRFSPLQSRPSQTLKRHPDIAQQVRNKGHCYQTPTLTILGAPYG